MDEISNKHKEDTEDPEERKTLFKTFNENSFPKYGHLVYIDKYNVY